MNIFSKLNTNEYNDRLEKILENKKFDGKVKNLLLSMLYKIENGYNDYEKVKVESVSKKEFIEKILHIIKEECSKLKIITPKTEASKPLEQENKNCKIDLDRGSILVYANEEDLLYSLLLMHMLNQEANSKDKLDNTYYEIAIKEFIQKAKCINDTEVIRDFDGWSWNNNIKEVKNIEYNLIFQNILMLDMNIEKKEFYTTNYIQAINQPYQFEKNLYTMILTLTAEENEEIKKVIYKQMEKKGNYVKLMNDKTKFLNKVTDEKKKISNEIKIIDELLNDKDKLQKEYNKRNSKLKNEEKIFSISRLADMLEKEREEKLESLKLKNKLIEPLEYIRRKKELEDEYQILKNVASNLENSEERRKMLIQTQLEFLKGFENKIEGIKDEENLEKLLYKFRYYCLLPISKSKCIKDVKELQEQIKNIINIIIDNCIDKEIITNFSNSASLCYNILKHIFTIKIIDLTEISIKINKIKEEQKKDNKIDYIVISIYDAKQEENSHKEKVNNLQLLQVKLNKKIPLFIR